MSELGADLGPWAGWIGTLQRKGCLTPPVLHGPHSGMVVFGQIIFPNLLQCAEEPQPITPNPHTALSPASRHVQRANVRLCMSTLLGN